MSVRAKKVMVSGCFDLLHSGHIAFFDEAASFGELHVCIGSDKNILALKGTPTAFSEDERLYMINHIKSVSSAGIASGSGMLDFEPDLEVVRPDIFVVNSDGHTPEKEALCRRFGVEYKVLERTPAQNLPVRASSVLKSELGFPYRICLAGGWMDQPWVSKLYPGSVVVVQILPLIDFNERSGMATSSRKVAMELWGNRLPAGDPVRNARLLFGAENPPGTEYVSGSQDHLGLLLPGINRLYYSGNYWPDRIDSTSDREVVAWLERVLHLIPVKPRPAAYNPIDAQRLTVEGVQELGEAGDLCWKSILLKDVAGFGRSLTGTLEAWKKLLPHTVLPETLEDLKRVASYPGAVFSGSGGGYLVVASDQPVQNALKVRVRTA
jgi:cytidyltransferase-like protein